MASAEGWWRVRRRSRAGWWRVQGGGTEGGGRSLTQREDKVVDKHQEVQYSDKVKTSTVTYRVAVSAGLASEFPTVPLFLRAVAMSPNSCWTFYVSAHKLCKWYAKTVKGNAID